MGMNYIEPDLGIFLYAYNQNFILKLNQGKKQVIHASTLIFNLENHFCVIFCMFPSRFILVFKIKVLHYIIFGM